MRSVDWIHVLCYFAGAALAATSAPAAAPAQRPPNIIIILADDQGFADVGVYGAKNRVTPHLDLLARTGTRFTHFHVAQAVCSASRAALLTGCYPNRIGLHGALFPDSRKGLNTAETTLAEVLQQRGYATGMSGKWHLGHQPEFLPDRHGFDESLCLPYSSDMWPHHPEAPPGTFPPLPLFENGRLIDRDVTREELSLMTARYTERAVSFIAHHRDRPFFFYLAHTLPHVPLAVHPRFIGKSGHGLYADAILEVDDSVGQILQALASNGLDRDTIVIFTSDNGPWLSYGDHAGSAGPLREGKGTSWEGGIRVPCLMQWPGRIPAGHTNNRLFMNIDLLPTLAGLAGAVLPDLPIDGRDIWPMVAQPTAVPAAHEGYGIWYAENELQAVMDGSGRWKLVLAHAYRTLAGRPGGHGGVPSAYEMASVAAPELYDLNTDIGETTDVATQHPEVLRKLLAFAETCRAELGDALTQRTGRGLRAPGTITREP